MAVASLPLIESEVETVREITHHGERVILGVASNLVLVASQSQPGVWHQVWGQLDDPYDRPECSCEGFRWRRHCRHLDVVRELTGQ